MKKIALEEHWALPVNEEIRRIYNEKVGSPKFADPDILISQVMPRMDLEAFEKYRIAEMDANEVLMQVLSFGSPGIQGIFDSDEAVSKAREINDFQSDLIKKYPGRFAGFAVLPTQVPDAAALELERAVTELGFKGALVNGHTHGKYLDEMEYWPIWECAAALGVPIYLHPYDPPVDQLGVYRGYNEMLGPTWCWNTETGAHAMRIVCSGLFEAFPKAKLIIGHMGEMIPYQLGRIDEGYTTAGGYKTGKLKEKPSYYVKRNVYITTSGLWYPETLLCAIQALGSKHILFAGDYPFVLIDTAVKLVENTPLSTEDKERIYFRNAMEIFNLGNL